MERINTGANLPLDSHLNHHHRLEIASVIAAAASAWGYDHLSNNALLKALGILPRIIITDTLTPGSQADITSRQAEFTTDPIEIPVPTGTAEASPTPSPTATTEPTKPVPQEGYMKTDKGYEFKTKWGETVEAPQPPQGISYELKKDNNGKDKLKFVAEEGNEYGAKKGEELGEFYPLVTTTENGQMKTVGGAVLDTRVAEKLQQEKNQKEGWSVVLPVDLTGIDNQAITVSTEKISSDLVTSTAIRITFPGQVPLINIIEGDSEIIITQTETYKAWTYTDKRLVSGLAFSSKRLGQESKYTAVVGPFVGFIKDVTLKSSFGEKIGTVQGWIVIMHISSKEADDTDYTKVVRLGNSLVFSKASQNQDVAQLRPSIPSKYKASLDAQTQEQTAQWVSEAINKPQA